MSYGSYPKYINVAEKRAKAEKKIKQLRKKNPDLRPIILEGQALARTWWGKAWNKNLKSYADYSNRIGRGSSYVRHGAVLDLQITPGTIKALVQGSRSKPYDVLIHIDKMKEQNWQTIKKECQSRLSSLPDLLAGKLPKDLQEIFMVQGKGLFPTPTEISFDCSCPDWASMCKHIAATLYGVGARLDEDPSLFFTLRQAVLNDLVSEAVQGKMTSILKAEKTKGNKVIADDQLADLFGISMDTFDLATTVKEETKRRRSATQKNPEESMQMVPQDNLQGQPTAIALVAHCIDASETTLSIKDLQEATGFPARKLYSILTRLKQQGRVLNLAHGFYSRTSS
ncbi:MAG: hypothetical protein KJ804_14005 [Proteobacteria bacterium]|nr:hypothetical protein [Pseudomonadota bacterium]MBU1059423.1 hypothetical protein [Pseudomonadota bacterium]